MATLEQLTCARATCSGKGRYRAALAAAVMLMALVLPGVARAGEVTDQNGRQVVLPASVARVVAIPIPLASMIMAVDGGSARLSGINPAARDDLQRGLLGRMFPEAERIPASMAGENFVPNVEALATAAPDVVIQWGDRGEHIVRPLAELGWPVVTLRYGDSALVAGWLRLVGAVLGKEARAEQLAGWFEAVSAEFAQRSATLADEARPRVVYLMRARSALQAAGRGTSMDGDIRIAGGRNVAAEVPGFAPVGVEQILRWNPEVILLNNFEPGLSPADILRDPRFADVTAVRQGRVYIYPRGGFRWDPPSQETPLALDWLHALFHPGLAQPGLRARIVAAYQMLYGYAADEADIDRVLRIAENGASADYLRLFAAGAR